MTHAARSKLALARPALMLIVLGTILGPLYYHFADQLNSKVAQRFTFTERGARWTLPDGAILHFSRGLGYKPVSLELDPNMNGLSAHLTFEFPPGAEPGAARRVEYPLSIMQGDQTILQRTIAVEPAPGAKVRAESGRFEIYMPGSYVLLLEEPAGTPLPGATVTLELWEHVQRPIMPIVWTGFGLLLAGAGVLVYSLATGRPVI